MEVLRLTKESTMDVKKAGRDIKGNGMPHMLSAGTTTMTSNLGRFQNQSDHATEFRQASTGCECGPLGKRSSEFAMARSK